jgi:hypothetical protein
MTQDKLVVKPPFIWPDNRVRAGVVRYAETPPWRGLLGDSDLVSGVIVGASDATVTWIEELLAQDGKRHICLVLVLVPAGPTRAEHLRRINAARAARDGGDVALTVRLLPMAHILDGDCERVTVPPTVIQGHDSQTGRATMCVGSVGDVGHDRLSVGSLNLVFQPDDAMRDAWRRWFQYLFSAAAALTPETSEIPHLMPAKGDPEAAVLWEAFKLACAGQGDERAAPRIDPKTGEVTADPNGEKTVPWDGGKTALDAVAQVFQQVYANGWLVTVDEATRIKPLAIPVKATLLGQQSERIVGALKQKQSFTLQVLDDTVDKAIEKCRKVTDLMELLTYPLSQGNRWLPDAAKGLLEKELAARNVQGQKVLWDALGGNGVAPAAAKTVVEAVLQSGSDPVKQAVVTAMGKRKVTPEAADQAVRTVLTSASDEVRTDLRAAVSAQLVRQLIERRKESIRNDLNRMYRELGQGDAVPSDKLQTVLDDVEERLTTALNQRITPRAVYNRIGAPDLTAGAPDENWGQPLALLLRAGRVLREMLTDSYFPRRFSGLAFSDEDFRRAMNVFGDGIATKPETAQARDDLQRMDEIQESDQPTKQKCQEVWRLIRRGEAAACA